MNSNQTKTLWISVACAAFAMFLLYSWQRQQREETQKRFGAAKQVLVAHADIAEMRTIDDSMIEFVEKPQEFIEPEAISDAESAVGWIAAAPIKKGEQILRTKLHPPGPETGISFEVSPTKRAVTIPIDDVRGVSRLIRPGDRVDLIVAIDSGKGMDQKREVRTMLQDVPVLATGLNMVNKLPRRLEPEQDGKSVALVNMRGDTQFSTIVVEVKPDDAQKLIYVQSLAPGSIFATLRNPNDRNPIQNLATTTLDDVLGRQPTYRQPAAVPAPAPEPPKPMPQPRRRGGFENL